MNGKDAGRAGQIRSSVLLRALARLGLPRLAADTAASAGLLLIASGLERDVGVALMVVATAIIVLPGAAALRRSPSTGVGPTGSSVLARTLVVTGFALQLTNGPYGWVATGLVVFGVLAETLLGPLARLAVPYVSNLPGITVRNRALLAPKWAFAAGSTGMVTLAVLFASGVEGPLTILIPAVQWLIITIIGVDALARIRQRRRAERRLPGVLAEYAPTFMVHWYAPIGSKHQVTMWLPYLERLGRPFVIVVRNPASFDEIAAETGRPVLVRRYGPELGSLVVPSLRTVFYVNTSPRNEPMLTFLQLNQVQLNHGDSDKAPSYRRAFRVFDKNFVAGQAAVDRFAQHGVHVPSSSFEIVGRPQIESIAVADTPVGRHHHKIVLYAPTWYGYQDDSRYSSLSAGDRIVAVLLQRGCTVIFRPHPWSRRTPQFAAAVDRIDALLRRDAESTGRTHLFGAAATQRLTLVDCFNQCHAMIADISSVVPDFLYSEKPFAVTVTSVDQSRADFVAEYPWARGAYLLRGDGLDWSRVLDDLLTYDPKLLERRNLKSYYLGPFPTGHYAEGFLDIARRYV